MDIKKDRWYLVEVYPPDLEEPQDRFVGRLLVQNEEESVFEDQEQSLYYLRFANFEINRDFISVRSELEETAESFPLLHKELQEIFGEEFELPKTLADLRQKFHDATLREMKNAMEGHTERTLSLPES